MNLYICVFVMALSTYLIRVLPMTLFRKPIRSPFIRSFPLCALCLPDGYDLPGNPGKYGIGLQWRCRAGGGCDSGAEESAAARGFSGCQRCCFGSGMAFVDYEIKITKKLRNYIFPP